jgi:perosamine synthetase
VGRDQVLIAMNAEGISPRRGIMAAHLEPAYKGHPHAGLPITERLTCRSLILPLYDDMTEDDQARVVAVLRRLAEPTDRLALADAETAGGNS